MKNKYYKKRNGEYYLDKTKEEIAVFIDINEPGTFIYYLKIMDYPYYEDEWKRITKQCEYPKTVFGRYISTMRLAAYKHFSFKDSDELNMK